jgi:hypothetical protein
LQRCLKNSAAAKAGPDAVRPTRRPC